MAKAKQLFEIKVLKNNTSNWKKDLNKNPNKLKKFINENFDFDDMGFDIDAEYVCCPFCKDTGYHGKVNYNDSTGKHNIYCYKCSDIKNSGHSYTPWDYLTEVYRIEEGGLSYLNAVISLYKSEEDFRKAFEGQCAKKKERDITPSIDKKQVFIDNIFKNCNKNILAFIDNLYGESCTADINQYIQLYDNAEYDVTNAGWDETDQNVEIFSKSTIPVKVVDLKMFDKYVLNDSKFIRKLFTLNTTFLYVIPTVSPNGNIVQLSFRIGDGRAEGNKPKVMKVKAPFKDINIPMLFGFHSFSGFQREMPIVLVEGEKDAIALQTIYPFTLAMGRNTLGSNINYLKYFTDKFIIIPDNDEAGLKGYEKIKEEMNKYGLKLKRISINNPKLKDVADVYTDGNWDLLQDYMVKLKTKFNIN